MENLPHLVSRMSLHEEKGEENQPSSYHMLEVPLEAVAVGKMSIISIRKNKRYLVMQQVRVREAES